MDERFVRAVGEIVGRNTGAVLTPELVEGLVRGIVLQYVGALSDPRYLADEVSDLPFDGALTFFAFRMDAYFDQLCNLHELHWDETEGYRHDAVLLPDSDAFRADEAAGRMVFFGVRDAHLDLVGNCALYLHTSRHTGELVATEDTLYLTKDARCPGVARAFIEYMEAQLATLGVKEVRVDSKTVNKVDRFMRLCGYRPVATRLAKRL